MTFCDVAWLILTLAILVLISMSQWLWNLPPIFYGNAKMVCQKILEQNFQPKYRSNCLPNSI